MQSEMELWLQDQENIYSGWGCVFLSIEPFGSAESRFVGRQAGRQLVGRISFLISEKALGSHRREMA